MRNETLRLVLDYRVPEYRLLEEAESRDLNYQLLIGRVMTDRMGRYEQGPPEGAGLATNQTLTTNKAKLR